MSPEQLETVKLCASVVHYEMEDDPQAYAGWRELLEPLTMLAAGLVAEVRSLQSATDGRAVFTDGHLVGMRTWAVATSAKLAGATEGAPMVAARLARVLVPLVDLDLRLRGGVAAAGRA